MDEWFPGQTIKGRYYSFFIFFLSSSYQRIMDSLKVQKLCKLAPAWIKFYCFQAMELEIQTHCKVKVEVQPTWKKGKRHVYDSDVRCQHCAAHTESQSSESSDQPSPSALPSPANNVLCCRICKNGKETSYWLGCGHKDSNDKQLCDYWVHQNCIGLFFKTRSALKNVPFFCPGHGKNNKS